MSKARTMIAYVLVRQQGYALGAVARYFARHAATVGTFIGRLAERLARNDMLRREIDCPIGVTIQPIVLMRADRVIR